MKHPKTLLPLLFALAVMLSTLILAGCPQDTSIADIQRDPGRFRDRDVTIHGRVMTSFGAAGEGTYEVDDGTGRIWVVTDRGGVPGQDSRVRVTGRVNTGITFAGKSFGIVLRENNRHTDSAR